MDCRTSFSMVWVGDKCRLGMKYYVPRWQALAEPAKNEPSETACRMAGTEIYDFDGECKK